VAVWWRPLDRNEFWELVPVWTSEVDDLALVDAARAGDASAFTALVVRYQRKVYAVALGIVRDRDQAWDVSQEAFVRVHGHLAEFKGDSSFQTWVMRIASHLAIDSLRRERKSRRDQLEDINEEVIGEAGEGILSTPLGNDPAATLLRRELSDRMQAALDGLPEIHRTILVLRELEGLSYEELAERLGLQKGTVMSRLFHARKKMQAALQEYHHG
jgi:RNA polymerase sigma-70 factor (ECF subfamily)